MKRSIVVERLAKEYEIGAGPPVTMLRERIVDLVRHPLRRAARRETVWALRDVSFDVDQGETIGIVGRNGAGKSTLLKILSRITEPTAGSATTHGRVASLLEVGTGFHDELTGRENIYLNGSILGMKKREIEARFDAIVSFSGVERFIDTPVKHYSSGMRLRLGFAVAAHLNPDILIVDEVLAVGDAGFQNKCIATLDALRHDGRTVLLVSHNMAAIESLCPRSVWLDEGRLRMDGRSADVVRAYIGLVGAGASTSADLRTMTRRRGTGEIRLTAVEFLSADRAPQTLTRTGDAAVIRLRYHAATDVAHPSVGFRLFTETGTLVTSASTWQNGIAIPLIAAGDGYVDVELPCVNLVPGRYSLSLWCCDGPYGSRTYDEIDHGADLEVAPGNPEQWGGNIDSRYGIVYLPRTWDLRGIGAGELVGAPQGV